MPCQNLCKRNKNSTYNIRSSKMCIIILYYYDSDIVIYHNVRVLIIAGREESLLREAPSPPCLYRQQQAAPIFPWLTIIYNYYSDNEMLNARAIDRRPPQLCRHVVDLLPPPPNIFVNSRILLPSTRKPFAKDANR